MLPIIQVNNLWDGKTSIDEQRRVLLE